MELPITWAASINLEQFPTYSPPEAKPNRSESIARFLRNLIAEHMPRQSKQLHLPSLSQMAFFFKCPHLEVYDAFRALRAYGLDFTLAGLDTPVEVWQNK